MSEVRFVLLSGKELILTDVHYSEGVWIGARVVNGKVMIYEVNDRAVAYRQFEQKNKIKVI